MKKIIAILVCLMTAVLLVSCSSGAKNETAAYDTSAAMATAEPAAAEADMVYDEAAYDMEEAVAQEAGAGGLGDLPNFETPATNRKLVYSASFQLSSRKYDEDYGKIKTALQDVGGYIEYEDTYSNSNEYGMARYTTLTLRVPVEKYNDFLDTLSGIGTVTNKQINTQDISDQYYDTDARIEILEQRQTRLMEYLEEARKMEDVVELERELSDVLYELDQMKGSKRGMDQLVNYSSVSVNLNEEITAETITSTGDPLGERAANAYNMSMTGVGNFLQEFAVGLAAAAPVLMLLAVIAVIVFLVIKLVRYLRKQWVTKHGEKVKPPKTPTHPNGGYGQPGNGYMPHNNGYVPPQGNPPHMPQHNGERPKQ